MKLNLVDRGNSLCLGKQLRQVPDGKIADANRPRLALRMERLQSAPALSPFPHGVVDQVKINIIQLELAQARVECSLRVSMVGIPQFGCDENRLPGTAAFSNGATHALLVAVHGRSIDEPVSRFQCGKHRRFTGRSRARLPHAQAELWNQVTVVE